MRSFSLATLQNCRAFLAGRGSAETVAQVLRDLDGRLAAIAGKATAPTRPEPVNQGAAPRLCPSCGRGPLAPVANRDGLRIVGCRSCRYSEVI